MVTGQMRNIGAHCVRAMGGAVRGRGPLVRETHGVGRYVSVLWVSHRTRTMSGTWVIEGEGHVGVRGLRT